MTGYIAKIPSVEYNSYASSEYEATLKYYKVVDVWRFFYKGFKIFIIYGTMSRAKNRKVGFSTCLSLKEMRMG